MLTFGPASEEIIMATNMRLNRRLDTRNNRIQLANTNYTSSGQKAECLLNQRPQNTRNQKEFAIFDTKGMTLSSNEEFEPTIDVDGPFFKRNVKQQFDIDEK